MKSSIKFELQRADAYEMSKFLQSFSVVKIPVLSAEFATELENQRKSILRVEEKIEDRLGNIKVIPRYYALAKFEDIAKIAF